jgi:type IV secretory pathway VirB10-like protein
MSPKASTASFIVVCLAAGVSWWLWPHQPPSTTQAEPNTPTPKTEAVMPGDEPPAEQVPPPDPAAVLAALAAALAEAEPQAELSTTIPYFVRLLKAGNQLALAQAVMTPEAWANMDNEVKAKLALGTATTNDLHGFEYPTALRDFLPSATTTRKAEKWTQALEAIQSVTPAYYSEGQEATYILPRDARDQIFFDPTNPTDPGPFPTLTFVKISGRWYPK